MDQDPQKSQIAPPVGPRVSLAETGRTMPERVTAPGPPTTAVDMDDEPVDKAFYGLAIIVGFLVLLLLVLMIFYFLTRGEGAGASSAGLEVDSFSGDGPGSEDGSGGAGAVDPWSGNATDDKESRDPAHGIDEESSSESSPDDSSDTPSAERSDGAGDDERKRRNLVSHFEFRHLPEALSGTDPTDEERANARARRGGGAGGPREGWDQLVGRLGRDGLDIVFCFDSTASMGAEINAVKERIRSIGKKLQDLVPKTRIGVCTYRDQGDEYVVKGTPLTKRIETTADFLDGIGAGGGGDGPEAVEEGLRWAIEEGRFRKSGRKLILLFGDAPPHAQQRELCIDLVRQFRAERGGLISTVTCSASSPIPDFAEIAKAGGGEAFVNRDASELVKELVIGAFGHYHRERVIREFGFVPD